MIKNTEVRTDKKEVWDVEWARIKDIYFWHLRWHYFEVIKKLRGTVCDLGCGPAYLAGFTMPNESFYTGVDVSPVGLEYAKILFPASKFYCVDLATDKVPLPDNSFDTVVASEIIEHLFDYQNVLSELKRLSKDRIVISVPTDLPNGDHVWPVWTEEDIRREFGGLGTITEIIRDEIYHFNVITIQK